MMEISQNRLPNVTILEGDNRNLLLALPDASIHSCVTDPPYGLSDIQTSDVIDCMRRWLAGMPYRPRAKGGFMGREWDAWVPGPETWREVYRVLKPGGHVLAFAGTRSMDLMSLSLRLAGFELRDSIGYASDGGGAPLLAWVYGSGFPKSLDVSKAIDKAAGAEREVVGVSGKSGSARACMSGDFSGGEYMQSAPATEAARQWSGFGTALKPAWEPIILARKPLDGTVAGNVLKHECGGLNIDGCRVTAEVGDYDHPGNDGIVDNCKVYGSFSHKNQAKPNPVGRFPANLIHSGEPRVLGVFPETKSGLLKAGTKRSTGGGYHGGFPEIATHRDTGGDSGSAARFFQCCPPDPASDQARLFYAPKASKAERNGSGHPTVKPLSLMRYFVRLVTPPGGTVLDPFAGSGATIEAAVLEGFNSISMEMDPEHCESIRCRVDRALAPKEDRLM